MPPLDLSRLRVYPLAARQSMTRVQDILFGAVSARSLSTASLAIGVPAILAFFLSVRRLRGALVSD